VSLTPFGAHHAKTDKKMITHPMSPLGWLFENPVENLMTKKQA